MRRSRRQQAIYLLSIAFAAAPFAFALIRAFTTGYDLRMLWMAFASFIGATAVMWVGKPRRQKPRGVLAVAAVALIVAMLFAGATAYLLGARAPFGIWAVAFVLAFCWATSYTLDTFSRPPTA